MKQPFMFVVFVFSQEDAIEQTERLISFKGSNYSPLIGLSSDFDITFSLQNETLVIEGWQIA